MVPWIRPIDGRGAVSVPAPDGFDVLAPRRRMKVHSECEWRRQSRLIDERDRPRGVSERLGAAAADREAHEPHDVTDGEAALQADAIETRLAEVVAPLGRIERGEYCLCRWALG